jgi:hypothetical protein
MKELLRREKSSRQKQRVACEEKTKSHTQLRRMGHPAAFVAWFVAARLECPDVRCEMATGR